MGDNQVQSQFRHKVKQVKYFLLITIIGVACIMLGTVYAYISGNILFQSIGIALFIGGFAGNMVAWRCPVCNKPLPHRQPMRYINYRSNCNVKLK